MIEDANAEELWLYADDLKLFKEVRSDTDSKRLQEHLECLYKWTQESLLQFVKTL